MIVSATGHRPNKLGGYGEEVFIRLVAVAEKALVTSKATKALSGMALGWDMAFARAAVKLDIPFVACIPFEGQDKIWPQQSKDYYRNLLDKAYDIVHVCEPGYAPWKMQVRNEYMVDNSELVIALWDGSAGGTGNCVAYAMKKNKPILNVYKDFV